MRAALAQSTKAGTVCTSAKGFVRLLTFGRPNPILGMYHKVHPVSSHASTPPRASTHRLLLPTQSISCRAAQSRTTSLSSNLRSIAVEVSRHSVRERARSLHLVMVVCAAFSSYARYAAVTLVARTLLNPLRCAYRVVLDPCIYPVQSPYTVPRCVFRRLRSFAQGKALVEPTFAFAP